METVSNRALNRALLARQLLLERATLDVPTAVERLGGLQGQHPPSPYIALWSRLDGFERAHLETALRTDAVVKTTVMRGTLHVVATSRLAHLRIATGSTYYETMRRRLNDFGADIDALRAVAVDTARGGPVTRREVSNALMAAIGGDLPPAITEHPSAVAAVAVTIDLVNLAEDAAFDYFGGSRYRISPTVAPVAPADAYRQIALDYLRAYGPATRADLAAFTGRPASAYADALAELDLVTLKAEDGRALLDVPDAPRPPADTPAPVRFLPKWDSALLAHARRERIFPDAHRKAVVGANGDWAPVFTVDGTVVGAWEVPRRGPAVLTLQPLEKIPARQRRAVEAEGAALLAWLRPDDPSPEVRWLPTP
jgi:winged helix DNA-binding protein